MAAEFYILHSLFDLTKTGTIRKSSSTVSTPFVDAAGQMITTEAEWQRSRNQQRNWETLVQLLSLRVQPNIRPPIKLQSHLVDNLGFDSTYGTIAAVWQVKFSIDVAEAFKLGNDPVGLLLLDFDRIPMITGLHETPTINPPYFITNLPGINITFAKLEE
jgi:hypothetical protein